MEVMNSTKDATDTEQQSYFYVVWPEEKSPKGTSGATATTLCSTAVSINSAPSSSATTFSYETQPHTIASGSSNGSSSSSSIQQVQSPAGSPLHSREAMRMASPQVLTGSTNGGAQSLDNCVKKHSDGSGILVNSCSMKPQNVQHVAAIPSLEACNSPVGLGKHRTLDLSHNRKVRYHQAVSTNTLAKDSNLREIGMFYLQLLIVLTLLLLI